jgi:hypothetical protein
MTSGFLLMQTEGSEYRTYFGAIYLNLGILIIENWITPKIVLILPLISE